VSVSTLVTNRSKSLIDQGRVFLGVSRWWVTKHFRKSYFVTCRSIQLWTTAGLTKHENRLVINTGRISLCFTFFCLLGLLSESTDKLQYKVTTSLTKNDFWYGEFVVVLLVEDVTVRILSNLKDRKYLTRTKNLNLSLCYDRSMILLTLKENSFEEQMQTPDSKQLANDLPLEIIWGEKKRISFWEEKFSNLEWVTVHFLRR